MYLISKDANANIRLHVMHRCLLRSLRRWCVNLSGARSFDYLVLGLIALNSVAMAYESPTTAPDVRSPLTDASRDTTAIFFFLILILIRIQ